MYHRGGTEKEKRWLFNSNATALDYLPRRQVLQYVLVSTRAHAHGVTRILVCARILGYIQIKHNTFAFFSAFHFRHRSQLHTNNQCISRVGVVSRKWERNL